MSSIIMVKRSNKYDLLERILNKTALTTKKVTHGNILGRFLFIARLKICSIIKDRDRYEHNLQYIVSPI